MQTSAVYREEIQNNQNKKLSETGIVTRILFGFVEILPTAIAMVNLHSLTAKYFNFAFGYKAQATANVTS